MNNKLTQTEFLEEIQRKVFGDYKELDKGCGHSIEGPVVMGGDFYSDLYGKVLTFIEATSDKSKVDQKKSIAKQLMRESQKKWLDIISNFMKYTEIQEIRIVDGKEVPVTIYKIKS